MFDLKVEWNTIYQLVILNLVGTIITNKLLIPVFYIW